MSRRQQLLALGIGGVLAALWWISHGNIVVAAMEVAVAVVCFGYLILTYER